MTALPAFRLERPRSLAEAVGLLSREAGARVLAGGTDLIPALRHGLAPAAVLVDLREVPELRGIELAAGTLRIGAGVTVTEIARSEVVVEHLRAVHEAALAVAGPAHRTTATLGGNLCLDTRCVYYNQSHWWRSANGFCLKHLGEICHVAPQGDRCHAAFSGDLAPALLAFDAKVELLGPAGSETRSLASLYRDDGARSLDLAPGQLVVAIRVPLPASPLRSGYRKARIRLAIDFPLAGVAAALALDPEARLTRLCVALTGTNSRPFVLAGTEALLGAPVGTTMLDALGKLVQKQVSPMRTGVVAAHYRRQVAHVNTQRLVLALADQAAAQ